MGSVEAGSMDERILRALDLDGVLAPPLLPQANRRVPAAWVLAWQQWRRERGWGPKRSRHIREISEIAFSAPAREWSRAAFALRADVAAAVDEAFPLDSVQSAAVAAARERLAVMVRGSSPLTHVIGLDAAGLKDAVEACREVLGEMAT
ncbi:MAG: hypothetical protein GC156_03825 [Actinomycetales bacterium]|nr:hypothetical protein [Actinomycetales bacterium]